MHFSPAFTFDDQQAKKLQRQRQILHEAPFLKAVTGFFTLAA